MTLGGEAPVDEVTQARAFVDTVPGGEPTEAGAENGERSGRRRNRRGGRGGRDRDESRGVEGVEGAAPAEGELAEAAPALLPVAIGADTELAPVDAIDAAVVSNEDGAAESVEREGRRRNRGRGRQRRSEEGGEQPATLESTGDMASDLTRPVDAETAPAEPLRRARRDDTPAATVETPWTPPEPAAETPEAAPATTREPVAQAPAPAPAAPAALAPAPAFVAEAPVASAPVAPVTTAYTLPVAQLEAVASELGLQWVNSDEAKIRAAQEAMAREPKPVHVPREIKPPVVVDEGPLVLVETRRDLAQVKLPFDTH